MIEMLAELLVNIRLMVINDDIPILKILYFIFLKKY